jgi:hypothetical protein
LQAKKEIQEREDENLHFGQRYDCIEGFEDCGSQGRTYNIAN